MISRRFVFFLAVALLLTLFLAACAQEECPECPECPDVSCPEPEECPEPEACPTCPEPEPCPEPEECPSSVEAPFEEMWASSGHADAEAEAFTHWDEDDPPEVAASCAKCHSEGGYLDFLGVDGTQAGVVDNNAPIGTTVSCVTCHNEATIIKTSVVFPSGVEITGLGDEARCMECHQGRASTASIDENLAELNLTEDLDTPSEDLGFTNIHYFAAAATQAGGTAKGGYQYEGKVYDSNFTHVADYDTCIGCHNPHTLELKIEECSVCHTDVASADDLKDVRMAGSLVDYDGDGDLEEGVYYEIVGLQEILLGAMQAYANDVASAPIVYDLHTYPYFFLDTDGNGEGSEDEINYGNRYVSWTGRLAKAAYNYQTSIKDPGAFAHGGKYIIQLLYDSIEDLNADLVANLRRIDHGHFAGSEEAFRHWDEDGAVSASCAKCHSADGLPFQLEHGVQIEQETANGLACATCHDDVSTFTRFQVEVVTFPSGAELDLGEPDSNLCINCHQGRESTLSVNARIGDSEDDAVVEGLSFRNVHYFAAGATLFGNEAQGGYEFEGQEYNGRNTHVAGYDTCIGCHSAHKLEVKEDDCATCHPDVDTHGIRMDATDWDGDGDTTEGVAGEIETLAEALYAALQVYSADITGIGIEYNAHQYPYFFDTEGEQFVNWTPSLLRAAYNYQYYQKDPGGFAHNGKYVLQLLYDSLVEMDADVSGLTRP